MDFSQISLLLVVAALFGILVKRFKQPILIGYLLAGFILTLTGVLTDRELVDSLGKVGVALLLFLVGLEMNIRELPTIGKVALFTGIGQIGFTFSIGLLLGLLLGFDLTVAAYLAVAASFSSTIIIVKLLSEKNALNSLYGKISVGFLLVQDLVAILILIFLGSLNKGGISGIGYLVIIGKAALLLVAVIILSKKVIPSLFEKFAAGTTELLFIVSIAWALGIASLVAGPLGFTLEVGGFLAGLALSNLPEHLEIASRTRPLRDFFLTLFFLNLGANLVVSDISSAIVPAIFYSLLVLVGNPIIVMIVMGLLHFKKRTSFLASVSVAQISEFSLIIAAMGLSLGHLNQNQVAMTVMVAAITMTASTYLILGAEKVYLKIKNYLTIFERKNASDILFFKDKDFSDHIVLVGCLRTGVRLLSLFKKRSISYLIVDFNPEVVKRLTADNHPVIFGDISDPEILEALHISSARLVISTIDNLNDNLNLLAYVRQLTTKKPLTILTSGTRANAVRFYQAGADYVVVPEVVAGDHIRSLLRIYGTKNTRLKNAGRSHFNRLLSLT